jgi:hypothetical protein
MKKKIDKSLSILGVEDSSEFLSDEIILAEKMLVYACGGNEEHWEYLSSGFDDVFYRYGEERVSDEELLEEIKYAIEEDHSGSIPVVITRG